MSDPTPSILVVDDDIDACENLSDILEDRGYCVDVAHEAISAMELVRQRAYDVVLLDYKMPGKNGIELCREIRETLSGAVPLMLTAHAGGDLARTARDAGVWRVLSKPVDLQELVSRVAEAAGRPLILIVDHDEALCLVLRDVLGRHNFRVCIAHDEAEAIDRLREATRVVLLDLGLSGRDSIEVFRRVRTLMPSARALLMTADPNVLEPGIERMRAEELDAICYKPLDIPRLLEVLGQLIEG